MKRLNAKINSLEIKNSKEIVVELSGYNYLYTIKLDSVNFYGIDEEGFSVQKYLKQGSYISFDSGINQSTRVLSNVEII